MPLKCQQCGKRLELELSQHLGACYSCRVPDWAKPETGIDPVAMAEQIKAVLVVRQLTNSEIDQAFDSLIAAIRRQISR